MWAKLYSVIKFLGHLKILLWNWGIHKFSKMGDYSKLGGGGGCFRNGEGAYPFYKLWLHKQICTIALQKFGPNLNTPPTPPQICFQGFYLYQWLDIVPSYHPTSEPNFRKWQKKLIFGPILACLNQICTPPFLQLVFVIFTSASS